jgi:SPP1 gp7 family putative phage head morphogenesis protein
MSGTDIPPRTSGPDWMDDAILSAILSVQLGNAAARRASLALSRALQKEVSDAIIEMGVRPSKTAIRAAMTKIDRAFKAAGSSVASSIESSIRSLVRVEISALPESEKRPGRREMIAAVMASYILGKTMPEHVKHWMVTSAGSKVKARVRHLAASGTKTEDIQKAVKTDIVSAAVGAGSVARTSMTNASSMVKKTAASLNNRKLVWISVLDSRTTVQCAALDGETWVEGDSHVYPPLHVNCRSSIGIHMGGKTGVVTYEQWLRKQGESIQNEVLGKARAKAWRDGKLGIDDMIDATRTRSLSLKSLKNMGRL